MRHSLLLRPDFASYFRCIGSPCEDTCCTGWNVYLEPEAVTRYHALEAGDLRQSILANLTDPPPGAAAEGFQSLRLAGNGDCPMLTPEHLCRIQLEKDHACLAEVCRLYPRKSHRIDELEETTLLLSCPEAARLILLEPDLFRMLSSDASRFDWDDSDGNLAPAIHYFWPLRELLLQLLRNRSYPLWQRLFLIGSFCRRLDQLAAEKPPQPLAPFLREFSAAIQDGALRTAMERIPANAPLQVELLMRLVLLRADGRERNPRFSMLIRQFLSGIGYTRQAMPATLAPAYTQANRQWLTPFLDRHPQFFENLLITFFFRDLFPFGESLSDPSLPCAAAQNFATLSAQFALTRGLLIGVAGYYREDFHAEQAVRTVQIIWKFFEHLPDFLPQIQSLLAASHQGDVQGLTMLVRD